MTMTPQNINVNAYIRSHDVRIEEIRIISHNGLDINISEHFQFVEFLEDMFSSNLTGRMTIIDGTNLPNTLKLSGQEMLLITFNTPNLEPISTGFIIDRISERLPLRNQQSQMYDIYFVFPSFINNIRNRVNKSYTGPISETVKDIFKNNINSYQGENSIELFTESTLGNFPVIIPNWRPIPAINWLAKRATSALHRIKSDYVFFQDLDGFRFMSLTTLKTSPAVEIYESSPVRSSYTRKNPDEPTDFDIQARNIEKLIIGGYDKSKEVMDGMYASKMIIHDITSKTISTNQYMYPREFDTELSLNGHPLSSPWADMYSPYMDSKQYLIPRHSGMYGGVVELENGLEVIQYADSDNSELWMQSHDSNINQLNSSFIEIVVQGDTNRRVGDKVIVNITDHSLNNTDDAMDNTDTTLSGNYLITKIKHTLSFGGGHEMQMRLNKDSFMEPLPSSWEYEFLDSSVTPIDKVLL